MLLTYKSRVVMWAIFKSGTTLGTKFTIIEYLNDWPQNLLGYDTLYNTLLTFETLVIFGYEFEVT